MQVLLLLAHADDETLGVGGSVQRFVEEGHKVQLVILSDGIVSGRGEEADNRVSLASSCEILGIDDCQCLGFPDQRFETIPIAEIASRAVDIAIAPDLIITHADSDLNRDHQIAAEAARIIGRPRAQPISMLACEIPSVSHWNGKEFAPNFYVGITEGQLERKVEAFSAYENEVRSYPDPYSSEGLRNIARFRGQESGHRLAEAFRVIRWNW